MLSLPSLRSGRPKRPALAHHAAFLATDFAATFGMLAAMTRTVHVCSKSNQKFRWYLSGYGVKMLYIKNKLGMYVEYTADIHQDILAIHKIDIETLIPNLYGTRFFIDKQE